jgi:hypothetical protein
MRGGNSPLFVEFNSNIALAFGVRVPIPTCAKFEKDEKINTPKSKIVVIVDFNLNVKDFELSIVVIFLGLINYF